MAKPTALIVDDDSEFGAGLAALVEREGFAVEATTHLAPAREALAARSFDVVLVDLALPDGEGLDLLDDARQSDFVVITGNASLETAVEALRQGAVDYLTKPIDRPRLQAVLAGMVRTRALRAEVSQLREELIGVGRFGEMIGRSDAMKGVYRLVERVAPTQATVMISGESGTGKELAALTIHQLSGRKDKGFVAVNCGAISPHLIESELFGHEKGSFTGANRQHIGYIEQANGGTLFLDEITEMPEELQVKLLRVLETRQVRRVGARDTMDVDLRVLAATNRDPEKAVSDGKLREDLFYRLNVFPIALPPLRDRDGDVELLARHFLSQIAANEGDTEIGWSREALEILDRHRWPGNVRELKNLVHRAFILAEDEIVAADLPDLGGGPSDPSPVAADATGILRIPVGTEISVAEKRLILATLEAVGGNKKEAAERLGVSLKTLYNRLNVYEAEQRAG